MLLVKVRGPIQDCGPFVGAETIPSRLCVHGNINGPADIVRARLVTDADDLGYVGRVDRFLHGPVDFLAADDRLCRDCLLACRVELCEKLLADGAIRQIDAMRIGTLGLEDVVGHGDLVVRRIVVAIRRLQGIGDDVTDLDRLIGDLVDERRVRTVLKEAAYKVRQQVFMVADRRVNATRTVVLVRIDDLRVQFLAHAVQPLELIVAARARVVQHARQRVGIVRRELRVDLFAGAQCGTCCREVGHVRV